MRSAINFDVFISHHTNSSRHIVEAYSGRDIVGGDYATSIMQAPARHVVMLLGKDHPRVQLVKEKMTF